MCIRDSSSTRCFEPLGNDGCTTRKRCHKKPLPYFRGPESLTIAPRLELILIAKSATGMLCRNTPHGCLPFDMLLCWAGWKLPISTASLCREEKKAPK
eukprot:4473019-Amphidinium_carterae.1